MLQWHKLKPISYYILKSGFSKAYIPNSISEIKGLECWQTMGEAVLTKGERVGISGVDTNTGRRLVHFISYQNEIYAFIYMHKNDPQSGYEQGKWHGDGFIRIVLL